MLNQKPTKLEMAIFIADTLFGKHLSGDPSVRTDNWKVKKLTRMTKAQLRDHVAVAERVRRGTANSEILDASRFNPLPVDKDCWAESQDTDPR